jgi:hypothetical protein
MLPSTSRRLQMHNINTAQMLSRKCIHNGVLETYRNMTLFPSRLFGFDRNASFRDMRIKPAPTGLVRIRTMHFLLR